MLLITIITISLDHHLIKTKGKWALSSVQLTVGSTEGATERNKPFPRKVCITACCAIYRTKHCVNRNGGMHSCAARQEGNYTLTQSSDSHSWSSAHKKHTGTVPSWTQAVRPTKCVSTPVKNEIATLQCNTTLYQCCDLVRTLAIGNNTCHSRHVNSTPMCTSHWCRTIYTHVQRRKIMMNEINIS